MPDISKKTRSAIIELISPGDRVLVAVSGGVDSLALLYLLEQFMINGSDKRCGSRDNITTCSSASCRFTIRIMTREILS